MDKSLCTTSRLAWALSALLIGLCSTGAANAVPSYARQTGVACQGCHTVFPELTPFGRSFKLNAYTIDNLPQVQGITSTKEYELLLNQVPPVSFMFQTSYTKTKSALPDSDPALAGAIAQNGQVLFPQQASIFYAGRIAPNMGAFVQITYDSVSGTFGLDNTELRYARQVPSIADGLTYGFTMNNNPTVQDVWNSTPAWQTPFDQRTNAAVAPIAAAQIDGGLGGAVAGLTGYLWWKNSVYAELGLYRSAPQGHGPIFTADAGPLDSKYQFIGDEDIVSVQGTFIKERQSLDATFALPAPGSDNPSNDLKTLRISASYYLRRTYGASVGYFSTTGSSDLTKYQSGIPVIGSASGSPNSKGWISELAYLPWQNLKLALQYVAYQKFNGAASNYDGLGRDASDNNTLYLL